MRGLAVGFLLCGVAFGEPRYACLEDRAGLNIYSRASFEAEFREILKPIGYELQANACMPGSVPIRLSRQAPGGYTDALGAARHRGGRILAELRIYMEPVLRLLGPQASSTVIGRALARVAAHELAHYALQRTTHDAQGLMREGFSGSQLASDDSTPFVAAKN